MTCKPYSNYANQHVSVADLAEWIEAAKRRTLAASGGLLPSAMQRESLCLVVASILAIKKLWK